MKKTLIVTLFVSLFALAACGGSSKGNTKQTASTSKSTSSSSAAKVDVAGHVNILGTNSISETGTAGEPCQGLASYEDVAEDTQVTLTDAQGTVVGTTTLTDSELQGSGDSRSCVLSFDFGPMTSSSAFFKVSVANHPEGDKTVKAAESGDIEINLGS